jgi:hypothetical protein
MTPFRSERCPCGLRWEHCPRRNELEFRRSVALTRAALILVFTLATNNPALACHRYSTWWYPWPQSCKSTPARLAEAPAPPAPPARAIVTDEESERVQAIEALKVELATEAAK